MATTRVGSHQPFGSSEWIVKEFNEISTICDNELEDFTFSARNEVEWLNEHMNEIFSNNKIRLAEILKTPGKLRGKTPRTARQRSPLKAIRHPLGKIAPIDKFLSGSRRSRTGPSSSPATTFEGTQDSVQTLEQSEVRNETQATYDSAYHENSDKEIEVELPPSQDLEHDEKMYNSTDPESFSQRPTRNPLLNPLREKDEEGRLTGSFHSAEENQVIKAQTVEIQNLESSKAEVDDPGAKVSEQLRRESGQSREPSNDGPTGTRPMGQTEADGHEKEMQIEKVNDIASENPTPVKPAKRGLSMSLPTLPEREPIGAKKSTGNYRGSSQLQSFNRLTVGKAVGTVVPAEHDANINESEDTEIEQPSDKNSAPASHSARSLHDRITALGKTRESRSTKSILPPVVSLSQPAYPMLPDDDESGPREPTPTNKDSQMEMQLTERQSDENWIAHTVSDSVPTSPIRRINAAQTATGTTPAHMAEEQVASHPEGLSGKVRGDEPYVTSAAPLHETVINPHGLMSSSKSRLQTLFSSAKGLFTSSATTSTLAKLEAATNPMLGEETNVQSHAQTMSSTDAENGIIQTNDAREETLYHSVTSDPQDEAMELRTKQEQSNWAHNIPKQPHIVMDEPSVHRPVIGTAGALRKPIAKTTKDQSVEQKFVPKSETISGRGPLMAVPLSTLQKEQEQSHGRIATGKKESLSSTATTVSNTSGHKGSMNSKAKVTLTADRKREVEMKSSQKKATKLDLERKKAARQTEIQEREHARQATERQKERERQTTEEKKRHELREAIDRKRAEAQAKREPHKEHKITLKSTYTKQMPKRVWQPEAEEETAGAARNLTAKAVRLPQHAGKRLRTEEEEQETEKPQIIRPMMQPPTRESVLKSALNPILLNKDYSRAPPPATRHAGDVQHNGDAPVSHHYVPPRPQTALDNTRFGNGAIPFATHPVQIQAGQRHQPPSEGFLKTPMQHPRLGQTSTQLQLQQQHLPKSSPIDGDHIHLSDPPTDSEEEDSETERQKNADVPNWARSPYLRDVLLAQDSIEPSLVFGPMPPLDMEEIFKGRGPRRDFRNRTSSANWVGGDRLTEDEVQKDIEARQKMRKDGGWTMELS